MNNPSSEEIDNRCSEEMNNPCGEEMNNPCSEEMDNPCSEEVNIFSCVISSWNCVVDISTEDSSAINPIRKSSLDHEQLKTICACWILKTSECHRIPHSAMNSIMI